MTADDVDMKEEPKEVVLEPFPTIPILQLVKDAQQQHGLRHGDYNRYRIYCKDKLRRVRSALKVTNQHKCVKRHKAKFTRKTIAEESFSDQRYVQIPLFEVERRWAQAMHYKTDLEDNPLSRKRHAMRNALKRAVQHVAVLDGLVRNSARCDAPTKLESQAYSLWLKGIVAFELKNWATASENLKAAKALYEKLSSATPNSTLANLYKAKCREIQPQLRLCEFNSAEAPKASMAELMQLKEQMGADSESIDQLIAEMRSKAKTEDAVPIEWGGVTAPAGDEKVRAVVEGWAQTDKELKECSEPKQKMALLEKQLADTRDAIEKLVEGQKRKVAEGATGLDAQEAGRLRGYLDYVRLSRTAQRYLAIIENTKQEKKHKPQDLLRLYDSVIAILKEVTELPGAENNKQLQSAYAARIECYRAFRCHYMACAYASLGRYDEAAALFERAHERRNKAEKAMKDIGKDKHMEESIEPLVALKAEIERAAVSAKAERLVKAFGDVAEDVDKAAEKIDNRPLTETMDEWREWNLAAVGSGAGKTPAKKSKQGKDAAAASSTVIPIAKFPPPLQPMPVKPMFFDLALGNIRMPDLTARLAKLDEGARREAPQGGRGAAAPAGGQAAAAEDTGIAGRVKGWFWGN